MKTFLKYLKVWLIAAIAVAAIAICVWMALANRDPVGVTPELALRDEAGNIVTGPSGEMFFEYSGIEGTASETTNDINGKKDYYISGVWRWNDRLECYSGLKIGTTKIAFRFNSVKTSETFLKITLYDKGAFHLGYSGKGGYGNGYGWIDPTNQLIDCGNEPQKVSKELYEYILANAVPATEKEYLAAVEQYLWEAQVKTEEFSISGYWVWNENIVFTKSERLHEWEMVGEFSTGQHFENFWFGEFSGKYAVMMYSKEENVMPAFECWNSSRGGWTSSARRYIYLGETPQTLSGDDYYFFIANATPCTKEEFDAMTEIYQQAA